MSGKPRRWATSLLGAVLIAGALFAFFLHPPRSLQQSAAPMDFVAFYCGAKVLPADPYLLEPLHTCEQTAFRDATGLNAEPYIVVPAPLPPYALALLEPIGALPFPFARAVWLTTSFVLSAVVVLVLHRLSGMRPALLAAGVFVGLTLPAAIVGQIVPFGVAALCVAVFAVEQKRYAVAAVFAALTLIEPHLGLPVCLSLAILLPRARLPLLIACSVLLALSLSLGIDRNVEYFTRVLPAHARTEADAFMWQYSLTSALMQVGASMRSALALGTLSYALMVAFAIVVARKQIASLGEGGILAIPAAFALLGGSFVHLHQMAFALPLVALLYPQRRTAVAAAFLLLMFPWQLAQQNGLLSGFFAPPHVPNYDEVASALSAAFRPGELAQSVWAAWVRLHLRTDGPPLELLLYKIPTWAVLAFLVVVTAGRTRFETGRVRVRLRVGSSP
jgi:hypothetical protein